MSEKMPAERPWQPWERNFSGGRVGVQEQQGTNENWIILHIESGGVKTTTSLRYHEAWDLALMLSPQLRARLDELFNDARNLRSSLYSLTYRQVDTDVIRQIADDRDCGRDCEYGGASCPRLDRDGCALAEADSLRDLAKAIDTANDVTKADILRAIDSCGGSPVSSEGEDWNRGYNAALEAAEREVRRMFELSKEDSSNG